MIICCCTSASALSNNCEKRWIRVAKQCPLENSCAAYVMFSEYLKTLWREHVPEILCIKAVLNERQTNNSSFHKKPGANPELWNKIRNYIKKCNYTVVKTAHIRSNYQYNGKRLIIQ
jgi:hypothetical protein